MYECSGVLPSSGCCCCCCCCCCCGCGRLRLLPYHTICTVMYVCSYFRFLCFGGTIIDRSISLFYCVVVGHQLLTTVQILCMYIHTYLHTDNLTYSPLHSTPLCNRICTTSIQYYIQVTKRCIVHKNICKSSLIYF